MAATNRPTKYLTHAYFNTTGQAYDACQCREEIKTGDTLLVKEEGVVGVAWAWPIAISAAHGAFHRIETPSEGGGTIDQFVADLGAANDPKAEHFYQACRVARENGVAICPRWATWFERQDQTTFA